MKFNTQWTRNHLIGIEDLTASEINIILETASSFKKTMLRSNKEATHVARTHHSELLYGAKHSYPNGI